MYFFLSFNIPPPASWRGQGYSDAQFRTSVYVCAYVTGMYLYVTTWQRGSVLLVSKILMVIRPTSQMSTLEQNFVQI